MYFKKISMINEAKSCPTDASQKGKNGIDIPNYGKDHFFDDEANENGNKDNVPAALAAKTAGGVPADFTIENDVNRPAPQEGGFNAKL